MSSLPHAPAPSFRRVRRPSERIRALGVTLDLVRPEEVMFHVGEKIAAGLPCRVANYNLHGIHLARHEPEFRAFCESADLIEVDSTPILGFLKLLGLPVRPFHRCTYLDWRELFWSRAEQEGWRVFYLGGAPGVADKAAENLRQRWPGAQIASHHGYFDRTPGGAENEAVLAAIATFRPHVRFVGMGMPVQEIWLQRNAERLPPCAQFSVGAAFDYEAGVQRAAPRWTGRFGLEWAWRLLHDPRRLFRRYCLEPWSILPHAVADVVAAKRRGRDAFTGPPLP